MDDQQQSAKQPKFIVGILVILSVFIIISGVWQLGNYLKSPFIIDFDSYQADLKAQLSKIKSSGQSTIADSDHDGLTDYDEVNLYYTSPYLEDSDSDGLIDYQEIKGGTNPNCPKGEQCEYVVSAEENNNLNQQLYDEFFASLSGVGEGPTQVALIRQALIESGISEEDLAQIDDATLIDLYNQTVPAEQQINASNAGATGDYTKQQLEGFTPAQAREFLISQGVSAEELDQLTDEQIMTTWQEVLSSF